MHGKDRTRCQQYPYSHQEDFILKNNYHREIILAAGEENHSRRRGNSITGSSIGSDKIIVPLVERKWDRMLFGIFTYDSPNEASLRAVNRETHLSYFHHHGVSEGNRTGLICSLKELLDNSTLARDPESCRIVYSFVIGGGVGHADVDMTKQVGAPTRQSGGDDKMMFNAKTRCLWEDPECGGKDINQWTLDVPKCNISDTFARELREYKDITLLSIPENHELGKTDTWFTYTSMLTWQYPELQIGFVGKIDSDNFIRWPVFINYLERYAKKPITAAKPFIYGGYAIDKKTCSGPTYGYACAQENFIAEVFVSGALVYMSTQLAQHVFMYGTTFERKRNIWIVGEDMQLANMAYSDPKIIPFVINHRSGQYGSYINLHCFNDPALYRREYYKYHPDQEKKVMNAVLTNLMSGTEGARASKGYIKWAQKQKEKSMLA